MGHYEYGNFHEFGQLSLTNYTELEKYLVFINLCQSQLKMRATNIIAGLSKVWMIGSKF